MQGEPATGCWLCSPRNSQLIRLFEANWQVFGEIQNYFTAKHQSEKKSCYYNTINSVLLMFKCIVRA